MKLLLLCAAFVLTGCSVIFVPTYHETEFNELVTIAAISSHGNCDIEQTNKLMDLTTHLKYYTELTPNNSNLHSGVVELDATVKELADQARPFSTVYCMVKLRIINKMALSLGVASGRKPQ